MKSVFGLLNINDLLKGLLVAILTAIVTGVYIGLQEGTFAITWLFFKPILLSGLSAGLA